MVLKRTMVVALPLSLDLPLSNTPDGSASRDVPGHYQRVMYRWTSAWSGLILISLLLFQFLVQFSSHWAKFIFSFFFLFFLNIGSYSLLALSLFFIRVHWVGFHHCCCHLWVLFLALPFLQSFLITSPS